MGGLIARLVRFCSVGALCVVLNLGLLWLLVTRLGVHYLVATVIAFMLVNLVGYALNRAFTFGDRDLGERTRLPRYYAVMGLSLLANLLLMRLLVEGAHVPLLGASLTVTALFVAFNFLNHSGWTFASVPRYPGSSDHG